MIRPVYLDESPQPNFIGILRDAPIFFRVEDQYGLDVNSLEVIIAGNAAILGGIYQPGFAGVITSHNSFVNSRTLQ
jgi:hypothetical protein